MARRPPVEAGARREPGRPVLPDPPPSPLVACGDLRLGTLRVQAPRPLAPAGPGGVVLLVAVDDTVLIRQRGRLERLSAGDLQLVPDSVEVQAAAEARLLQVVLPPARALAAVNWQAHLGCRASVASAPVAALVDLLGFLMAHADALDAAVRRRLAQAVVDLVTGLLPTCAHADPAPATEHQRRRAERYMLDHLDDPDLDVDRIARELRVSRRYLHNLFRHGGPMHWARDQRLQACHDELATRGSRTVSEVAYAWGFRSTAHFSRVFRERFGKPPSAVQVERADAAPRPGRAVANVIGD